MSGLSFSSQKDNSESSGREGGWQKRSSAQTPFEETIISIPEAAGIAWASYRPEKLEGYSLLTQRSPEIIETDFQPEINDRTDKILSLLKELKEDLSNPVEAESIFSNILQYHRELWDLRSHKEKSFAELLVTLESAIKYYDVSELTLQKVEMLIQIFSELKQASLKSDFPKMARKDLRKVGFDLMRPILGVPEKFSDILKKLESND
ncbi:MAG: hypothetical protein WC530_00365 [Candidatus Omnitrophota bacterium]|jgi:hypothetical protein